MQRAAAPRQSGHRISRSLHLARWGLLVHRSGDERRSRHCRDTGSCAPPPHARLVLLVPFELGVGMKFRNDDGSATAEYAIATMAAVGFAGLLVVIMRSEEVRGILEGLIRSALTFGG